MTGVALPLSGGRHRKLIPGAVALGRAAEDSCIPSGLSLSHLFKINAKKIENLHMPFVQSSGILLRQKKKKMKCGETFNRVKNAEKQSFFFYCKHQNR